MDRRSFIRNTSVAAGGLALGAGFWSQLYSLAGAAETIKKVNPYGPLGAPDANGIRLPAGFTSRVVAETGAVVPGPTGHPWHHAPDGGAVFKVPGGGGAYVYVSNSEAQNGAGGASALKFAANGTILDAYPILSGTTRNCAGGPTPWGRWLSCEETDGGQVWECNPFVAGQGTARPALGTCHHEAAAVDPEHQHVYLSEDSGTGRLYRFIPANYPNLNRGRLQVARVVKPNGKTAVTATEITTTATLEWVTVSNGLVGPDEPRPENTTKFPGGEGLWFDEGWVYLTTKGDQRVYRINTNRQEIELLYDDKMFPEPQPLGGIDNVVVNRGNEIVCVEDANTGNVDGANGEINIIRIGKNRTVGPLLRIDSVAPVELTGPAFSPKGDCLYFSSQKANGADGVGFLGKTFEVEGPFRGAI